ncbi:hypothetical protein HFP57_02660 [Parasphingopyxis algicola]|uniref:hypothetical protein n=1 Tax=Parasphingopyxis algicola TaxID=2026624 RepID=UPI0015A3E642|nr:hypothetical protein [Parasphingopyxis algicola]QLC24040.1 hypothetical protein HFP57_02660 [Parasphingopyxis algicola]
MTIAAPLGTIVILTMALVAAPADGTGAREWRGQCEYADRFAPLLEQGDHSFALCDSVAIDPGGDRDTFDFRRDSWGSMIRFEGALAGDRMAVSHIRLRANEPRPATGTCEIFHRGEALSTIACVATARGQTYVANFVPRR